MRYLCVPGQFWRGPSFACFGCAVFGPSRCFSTDWGFSLYDLRILQQASCCQVIRQFSSI